jgi:hypothetical protein
MHFPEALIRVASELLNKCAVRERLVTLPKAFDEFSDLEGVWVVVRVAER